MHCWSLYFGIIKRKNELRQRWPILSKILLPSGDFSPSWLLMNNSFNKPVLIFLKISQGDPYTIYKIDLLFQFETWMTFASPPAFGTSSIFHCYSEISDRAGALVISTARTQYLGCDLGAVFNFTFSLLPDFFQALATGARTSFFPTCYTAYAKEKNVCLFFIAKNLQNTSSSFSFLVTLNAEGSVCVLGSFIFAGGLLQVIKAYFKDTGSKNSKNGPQEMENWVKKWPALGIGESVAMLEVIYLAAAVAAVVQCSPKLTTAQLLFSPRP